MGFRTLLALVVSVVFALLGVFMFATVWLVYGEAGSLLPASVAAEVDGPYKVLFASQALALVAFGVLLALASYFFISSIISKPLRVLARAMESYAREGVREPIEDINDAPKELRSLAVTFGTLIDNVEAARKRDSDMSRVKSDFISTAAHQLRTPLTGIRWALEALEKEQLTENQKALVQSAVGKSHDLVAIVGTLLDISAIESGKYQYNFVPTDVSALAEALVQDFTPKAAEAKVSLFFAHDAHGTIAPARADKERIKWVLNNLIDNAIDYTPAGGTVRISVDAAERRVFIRVKDTGIGIMPEDRANIFERFYRTQNAIAKKNGGNGLGLYIARTIATDHGGELNFAPNEGGPGTTFTLSLPVA